MKLIHNSKLYIIKHIIAVIIVICTLTAMLPSNILADDKVQIAYDGITVDSFCGVPAVYVTGIRNTDTGTYCCAQYVKNFYSAVYGASLFNLLPNQTPINSNTGSALVQVDSPQPGDIGYQNTSSGLWHWFIVKSVNKDTATIIEQNWKWNEGGSTYTCINRTVSPSTVSSLKYFRLSYNQTPAGQTEAEQISEETEYYEETISEEIYFEVESETALSVTDETDADYSTTNTAATDETVTDEISADEISASQITENEFTNEPLLETRAIKLSDMNVDAISSAHPYSNDLEIVAGFEKLSDNYDSTSFASESLKNTISFCLVRNTLDLTVNQQNNLIDNPNNQTINLALLNNVRNCMSDDALQHLELAFASDAFKTSSHDSIQLAFR